jgi:phage shock protein PspC (stress-responsive transcriptional regulator)
MESNVEVEQIGGMGATRQGGPRVTGAQVRDLNRLRRPTEGRVFAGVAAGLARHLDIDPTIVRVLFGALTIFGGAGILLYGIAWLTIPEEGSAHSAASDLLRRDAHVVMQVGLILAAVVAGMTMMGTLVWSSPNPWPVMFVALLAVVGIVLFSRRPDVPLPAPDGGDHPDRTRSDSTAEHVGDPVPPPPAGPVATPGTAVEIAEVAPAEPPGLVPAVPPIRTEAALPTSSATGPVETSVVVHRGGPPPPRPDDGVPPHPPTGPPPAPPPPPPRRVRPPRSRLFAVTLCVLLLAEGLTWIIDQGMGGDVHPSVYPGVALGITAAALLVGAWFGRSRLLILVGVLASIATLATLVIGPGPHGQRVYDPQTAAAVADRYEHGAGEVILHLEDVADIEDLAGRTIEVDARVGSLRVYVPTSLDVTIDAFVDAGEIVGVGHVDERGSSDVHATTVPTDDADPDVTLELTLKYGEIDVRHVVCPGDPDQPGDLTRSDSGGGSDVPAACN